MIRNELTKDYREVENLTREAFWNLYFPGCDEHYLAHILRDDPYFIKELDFVKVIEEKIVGYIMYSKSWIETLDGFKYEILTFGPLAVLPEFQNMGVGRELLTFSMEKALEMGYKAVSIYGNPGFYSKFGFRPAKDFGIYTSDLKYMPAHQIIELEKGALENISGKHIISDVFNIDMDKVEEFDKNFNYKEKKVMDSQKLFLEISSIMEDVF